MHYLYLKKNPKKGKTAFLTAPSLALTLSGLILIASAIIPIFSYQLFISPKMEPLKRPLISEEVLGENNSQSLTEPDFTDPSVWFPTAPKLTPLPSKITHYNLSIPKLKIDQAVVEIGGQDLKKSLVQYEGTAFPGQFGNSVIYGHSVLPQFYNPKNYTTIFATLPTLKIGDEILVDFDGIRYRYLVEEMVEVKPTDISVLEQRYDDSFLTLITCVPPGTYLRRLAVRARLTKNFK
jgi:sortase A